MKNKMTIDIPLKDEDFRVSGWCGNRPKCVQVAVKREGVAIRDSKDPEKSTLTFTHEEWDAFVKGVRDGQFNPLA
jgi:hypothetical protein